MWADFSPKSNSSFWVSSRNLEASKGSGFCILGSMLGPPYGNYHFYFFRPRTACFLGLVCLVKAMTFRSARDWLLRIVLGLELKHMITLLGRQLWV